MITITPSATEQIQQAAKQSESEGLKLRIAAKVAVDESVEYGMGFDEEKEGDIVINVEDVNIVIAPSSAELLNGAELDFVEIEDNKFEFIFLNPNDPNYKPPKEEDDNKS